MLDIVDRIFVSLGEIKNLFFIIFLVVSGIVFLFCVFMAARGIRNDEMLKEARLQRQQNTLYPLYRKVTRQRWMFLIWPPLLLVGIILPVVRENAVSALILWTFVYLVCIVGGSIVSILQWKCPRCGKRLNVEMERRSGFGPELQEMCPHCKMEFGPIGKILPRSKRQQKKMS